MIFWKEWRVIRGRFLTMTAFYGITLLLLPVEALFINETFEVIPISLLMVGVALAFIPIVLGMDAWVVEKDEETEDFLLSKPVSWLRLLMAKVGLRTLLTFLLTGTLYALVLIRMGANTEGLYLWMRPYVVWYLVFVVLTGHLIIVVITAAVSVRAPYQSTALIIGGLLGVCIAGLPVFTSGWQLLHLQAPWDHFLVMLVLLVLAALYTVILFQRLETGRSTS